MNLFHYFFDGMILIFIPNIDKMRNTKWSQWRLNFAWIFISYLKILESARNLWLERNHAIIFIRFYCDIFLWYLFYYPVARLVLVFKSYSFHFHAVHTCSQYILCIGGPLIVRFFVPEKTVLMEIPTTRGVLIYGMNR